MNTFDANGARRYLQSQGWPGALQEMLIARMRSTPVRFFLYHDTSSMGASDGRRLLKDPLSATCREVRCSRWAELMDMLTFHAQLSQASGAVSAFRATHDDVSQALVVGRDHGPLHELLNRLTVYPHGRTNRLAEHVAAVAASVRLLAAQLAEARQRAVVVLVTDVEELTAAEQAALLELAKLPVKLVFRLISGGSAALTPLDQWLSEHVFSQMVATKIGNVFEEAEEVHRINPWFTYSQEVHHLREIGADDADIRGLKRDAWSLDQIHALVATT